MTRYNTHTHTHTMIRRRPTEEEASLPESLENTAPQGSQLSALITQYNSSVDPIQRISLFRQLGEESEKEEYAEQLDAQVESQSPDETVPEGADEQINAQAPPIDEEVDEEDQPAAPVKTQAQLDKQEQRRFALASQAAYDVYYTSVEEAQAKLQQFMPAHHILPQYTDSHSTVIEKIDRTGRQELIIAYRGTDPLNPTDVLLADAQIAAGLPFERLVGHPVGRFAEADEKYKRLIRAYPKATIYATGHSLGASQALVVGERHPIVVVRAFNPGSSPLDLLVPNAPSNPNTRIYRVPGDPISYFAYDSAEDVVNVKSKKKIGITTPLAAHDLDNFLPWWVLNADPRPSTTTIPAPVPAPTPPATPTTSATPAPSAPAPAPSPVPAPAPVPTPPPPVPMPKFSYTPFGGFTLTNPIEYEEDEYNEEEDDRRPCYFDFVLMKKVCPSKKTPTG